MTKRKTIQEVISDINNSGVFVPDFDETFPYKGNRYPLPVKCIKNNHIIKTPLIYINSGSGCIMCSKTRRKTIQEVISDINNSGVFVPDFDETFQYKYNGQRIPVICVKAGHHVMSTLHKIIRGGGCSKCSRRARKSIQEVLSIVEKSENFIPNFDITFPYRNSHQELPVICKNNHHVNVALYKIARGGSCPECQQNTFSIHKPSYFYIVKVGSYIGFGITNNLKKRLAEHEKNVKREGLEYQLLETHHFKKGGDALKLETYVKRNLHIINTGIDGFLTEAVSEDNLTALQTIIQNQK